MRFHLCPLSSLSTGEMRLERIIFHDSSRTWPRRSTGNGREPSQPQPERHCFLPHQAARRSSEGRAADEAAAMRKLRACPLADAIVAGFVKRPRFRTFGFGTKRRERDFGFALARRKAGRKSARCHRGGRDFGPRRVGQDRVSARELRSGRPGTQVHGLSGRAEASAEAFLPGGETELRLRLATGGSRNPGSGSAEANRQGFGPDGEPAGKPKGA
jgi:hypothetical protein